MSEKSDNLKDKFYKSEFYFLTPASSIKALETNEKTGLNDQQFQQRQKTFGKNELAKQEKESIWDKIKEQFEDRLVRILIISALISFGVSQLEEHDEDHGIPSWVEPTVIFAIIILNGFVAIYQDLDAEKALDALSDLQPKFARVVRNGKEATQMDAVDLVPGDIVHVSQGSKVPADLRIIQIKTATLQIDQSMLTGEAQPQHKETKEITVKNQDKSVVVAEQSNMMFSGTLLSVGSAVGVVTKIGMESQMGVIQQRMDEAGEDKSPLKIKIEEFSGLLEKIIMIICVLCWAMNIPNFNDPQFGGTFLGALYYFKIAVALAVAAIPEGLPAVITTCLALGTRRMAKQNAIIRKLDSVETLGCTTVICSDKTGTLTTNQMCVEEFFVVNGENVSAIKSYKVTGSGYNPFEGEVTGGIADLKSQQGVQLASKIIALCTEAKVQYSKDDPTKIVIDGLPTEASLVILNEKIGKCDTSIKKQDNGASDLQYYNKYLQKQLKLVKTFEFTRDRKAMSVLVEDPQTKKRSLFTKGAPDYLLAKATKAYSQSGQEIKLEAAAKKQILSEIEKLASQGLRTLALFTRSDVTDQFKGIDDPNSAISKQSADTKNFESFEKDLTFVSVVGMRDPPRKGTKEAIQKCNQAGISVIMITGDIKQTADRIGKDLSIIQEGQEKTRSILGLDFTNLPEDKKLTKLQQVIDTPSGLIFARTEPGHKQDLVKYLKQKNQIVAMTGDGVNDAPALKEANIGIAMGIAGTEVAKNASKMVLADDNFTTIVAAVEEGRAIYANMKAFIRYMISSNIGEVVSIFLTSLLGIPDGFNSVQLLWVNLVTDGPPATALSFNPPDPDVMKKPPRGADDPLISGFVFFRYLLVGIYVGIATVGIFVYWYIGYDWAGDGHPLIKFSQLKQWTHCSEWKDFKVSNFEKYDFSQNSCLYFSWGKQKASTLSLTVLVIIEMFNALNALSDEQSILSTLLFSNPILWVAIIVSTSLHCMILYVPFFEHIFNTVPLNLNDWKLVLMFSFPVVLLDEIIKAFSRYRTNKQIHLFKVKHHMKEE